MGLPLHRIETDGKTFVVTERARMFGFFGPYTYRLSRYGMGGDARVFATQQEAQEDADALNRDAARMHINYDPGLFRPIG